MKDYTNYKYNYIRCNKKWSLLNSELQGIKQTVEVFTFLHLELKEVLEDTQKNREYLKDWLTLKKLLGLK